MAQGNSTAKWKARDFLNLSVFSFGSTAFSLPLATVVLPVLVLFAAPDDLKNTYVGLLGFAGLVVGIVAQPLAGRVSDRTVSPWGQRTPYLVIGSLLASLFVFAFGLAPGFMLLLITLTVTQLFLSSALGPYQALIRDLAPPTQRGLASSLKVLADGIGGITFLTVVAFLLGLYTSLQNPLWLWLSLVVISVALGTSAIWTARWIHTRLPSKPGHAVVSGSLGSAHTAFVWFLGSRFCVFAALAALQTYALFFLLLWGSL